MNRKLCLCLISLLLLGSGPLSASAETVVERVARTGVLTAGTRRDVIPFAYVDEDDNWQGYSIDLLDLIRRQLELELDQEIELELVEVSLADRIPLVRSGEVDILCDITHFTWERDRYIDFTLPYFQAGTRLLVPEDSPIDGSAESLLNRRIGVVPETLSGQVVAVVQPEAELVLIESREQLVESLESGDLDGVALDGILLEAARRASPMGDQYKVVPSLGEDSYDRQNYACLVPENNSTFLNYANFAIGQFMMGVLIGDEGSTAILDRWFGEEGEFPLDQDLFRRYFQIVIGMREQINLDPIEEATQEESE